MVLFFDGCGEYYNTQVAASRVWGSEDLSGALNSSGGRRGGAYFSLNASDDVSASFPNRQEIIIGWAMRFNTQALGSVLTLFDASVDHLGFTRQANGSMAVTRGTAITLGTTDTALLTENVWHYIEVRAIIDNAVGEVEIRIDGVQRLNLTNVDTQDLGNPQVDRVQWPSIQDMDDVYILDTTGPTPQNTFLGDVQIDAIFPTADGAVIQFDTPVGSVNHWENVNEATPNDDTDYNETPTTNDVDVFEMGDLPVIGGGSNVLSVKQVAYVKKTEAGLAQAQLIARPLGINRSSTVKTLQTDYNYHTRMMDVNPETNGAWTDATVNATEFGVGKIS